MISNQVLQHTVDGLKNISKLEFCVLDANANKLAATAGYQTEEKERVQEFISGTEENQVVGLNRFLKVYDEQRTHYILSVSGTGQASDTIGRLGAFQLQSMLVAYKEKFDKDNFIKNLLMDNLLMVDVFAKAKKLHIDVEIPRAVYLIETEQENDSAVTDKLKIVFPDKTKDFITTVNERSVAVVKALETKDDYDVLDKTAQAILHSFSQTNPTIRIAYGTIVSDLRDVSRSFKEARMALEVGKIFYEEKKIAAYNTLGIGRLIYQLPIPLCEMYIKEIFRDKTPDDFDEETLITIDKFFENSLNVSETSRKLFIHRNTLVYRLEKLKKMTGLDLHNFDDAITFKIALMVVKYMKYMETRDSHL